MRLAIGVFFILTSSAFACPDLSGTYQACVSNVANSQSNSMNAVWEQTIQAGVTTYTTTETSERTQQRDVKTFVADGVAYSSQPSADVFQMSNTLTTTCDGDQSVTMNVVIMRGQQQVGLVDVKVSKVGTSLVKEVSGYFSAQNFAETITCD